MYDLAQATFSLQCIPRPDRVAMLRAVRARTKRLLIAEFNVDQSLADANVVERERVRWILSRYTVGIQEYIELQDPVIGMSISGKTRVLVCLHEARLANWCDCIWQDSGTGVSP